MKRALLALAFIIPSFSLTACSSDPYEEAIKTIEAIAEIADKNKDDCDKFGDAFLKYVESNKSKIEKFKKLGEDKEDEKAKEAAKKYEERGAAAMGKLMGPMMKCNDNEKVKKAGEILK